MDLEILDWPDGWEDFGTTVFPKLNAHHDAWISGVANGLSHQAFLVRAKEEGLVTGLLPLMLVKGPIFGRFLVSLPYVNTGGVWARDETVARGLIDQA